MKKVCLLINRTDVICAYNYLLLANALNDRGDCACLCFVDSLAIQAGDVVGKVLKTDYPLKAGAPLDADAFESVELEQFDYVWVLSFGIRATFLDKMEILWSLGQKTRVINSIESLIFLHSKHHVSSLPEPAQYPETYASSDFDLLWNLFNERGGTWIVKPPAEGFGKDVFVLKPGDTNVRAILQSMTGHKSERYCIMQRFVPEISSGEKRVLFAAGQVVGQYKRVAQSDHRTNLHQGAIPTACSLTAKERELCDRIGSYLVEMGAYFVGIDMVYPYIIELNVLAPGGIATIASLTGHDPVQQVLDLIIV
jgi:glutathione synthase